MTSPALDSSKRGDARATKRINIGPVERVARVLLGTALTVIGIAILAGGPSTWGLAGAVLLAAVGADLIVTGARGYCPLYARVGHTPRALRGTS